MADFLTGMSNYPVTNADRIRAMSDEELAKMLCNISDCGTCWVVGNCWKKDGAWLHWLQSPAGEVEDDET